MTHRFVRFLFCGLLCGFLVLSVSACRKTEENTVENAATQAKMTLASPAFEEGAPIPEKYTCQGPDVSPPLEWSNVPEGTKSLAMVVEDPDAPGGPFVHWVIYNIPPAGTGLPEDVPGDESLADGSIQGQNGFHRTGYAGPCPPPGKAHRYFFRIFALSDVLPAKSDPGEKDLMDLMRGRVIGQGELMGTAQR